MSTLTPRFIIPTWACLQVFAPKKPTVKKQSVSRTAFSGWFFPFGFRRHFASTSTAPTRTRPAYIRPARTQVSATRRPVNSDARAAAVKAHVGRRAERKKRNATVRNKSSCRYFSTFQQTNVKIAFGCKKCYTCARTVRLTVNRSRGPMAAEGERNWPLRARPSRRGPARALFNSLERRESENANNTVKNADLTRWHRVKVGLRLQENRLERVCVCVYHIARW